jgi:hypothetical protein
MAGLFFDFPAIQMAIFLLQYGITTFICKPAHNDF